jgi:hypothetical protein
MLVTQQLGATDEDVSKMQDVDLRAIQCFFGACGNKPEVLF